MSISPTMKKVFVWIFIALVVVALGPRLIDFVITVLEALKGLIPGK